MFYIVLGYFIFFSFIYLHQIDLNSFLLILSSSYIELTIALHHFSFIFHLSFYILLICMILNHYFTLRNLNLISKKIFQLFISIKIIFRLLNIYFSGNNI